VIVIPFLIITVSMITFYYYYEKLPLNESVEISLYMGIFYTALITAFNRTDYQLIVIGIALGITMFLLTIVLEFCVYIMPLKDSIKRGLIAGISCAILLPIITKSVDLLIDFLIFLLT